MTLPPLPPLPIKRRAMFCTKCGHGGETDAPALPTGAQCPKCNYTAFVQECDYSDEETRTYAEQYGRLCAEAPAAELDRLHARVAELEAVIDQSARVMHGEGVSDQGEAWDQCLRILDTVRKAKP